MKLGHAGIVDYCLIYRYQLFMNKKGMDCWLVSWYFKPSQPQRIISGLKETVIKRYIAERTNKAEIKPEEQSEKAESCRENSWNEIQFKGL